MGTIRSFFREHRRLAAMLIVVALAMKALVPAGYMPSVAGKVLTVAICADASGGELTQQIVLPTEGKAGTPGKSEGSCAFASLAMAGLGGVDMALLALALAFILALGFAPLRPARAASTRFLRPPLRGPPAGA